MFDGIKKWFNEKYDEMSDEWRRGFGSFFSSDSQNNEEAKQPDDQQNQQENQNQTQLDNQQNMLENQNDPNALEELSSNLRINPATYETKENDDTSNNTFSQEDLDKVLKNMQEENQKGSQSNKSFEEYVNEQVFGGVNAMDQLKSELPKVEENAQDIFNEFPESIVPVNYESVEKTNQQSQMPTVEPDSNYQYDTPSYNPETGGVSPQNPPDKNFEESFRDFMGGENWWEDYQKYWENEQNNDLQDGGIENTGSGNSNQYYPNYSQDQNIQTEDVDYFQPANGSYDYGGYDYGESYDYGGYDYDDDSTIDL